MDTVVVCPECGGVIGGTGQDGLKPCTCLEQPNAPIPGMPAPPEKHKVCCKCGKNLEGKKRYKDSLGYWCEACHYSEKREKRDKHVPCDSCGRYVAKDKLTEYENIRICTRCLKDRRRQARKVRRPVVFGHEHKAYEKKTTLYLAIAAIVLALIILLATYGWLPSPI